MQVITLCELGGAQSVLVSLVNELCKDHEMIVVAGEGDGKMWSMLRPEVKTESCKHLKRALSPVDDLLALIDFKKLYCKYKPDIIQLHSSKAGMLGRIAFPSKKVIYTVHGFDSIRLAYRKFLPIERYMQKFCKVIVGVSQYDRKNLLTERIKHNVTCVYNGIKRPISLPQDPFFEIKGYKARILCIARLAAPKRCDLFLDVAHLLPDLAFIWIGNHHPLDAPSNVFFMGNLPNAGAYNEYADLFMLPSDYEGLPVVIIEAMSLRKPIVASNVGGINEIVRNGENGYVVDNNAEEFAQKIRYIIENSSVYETFCNNSLRYFSENLSASKMAERYLEIYKS